MNQTGASGGLTIPRKGRWVQENRSEFEARSAQNLMRSKLGVGLVRRRRTCVRQERDAAATADAPSEHAQAVDRNWAVPDEAAAVAAGRRFRLLVQRPANVPSRCSSAFEIFCAAGSEELSDLPGACAYG
jgi:hypothetical protein